MSVLSVCRILYSVYVFWWNDESDFLLIFFKKWEKTQQNANFLQLCPNFGHKKTNGQLQTRIRSQRRRTLDQFHWQTAFETSADNMHCTEQDWRRSNYGTSDSLLSSSSIIEVTTITSLIVLLLSCVICVFSCHRLRGPLLWGDGHGIWTCATISARAVHTEVRQALTSQPRFWLGRTKQKRSFTLSSPGTGPRTLDLPSSALVNRPAENSRPPPFWANDHKCYIF